MEENKNKQEYDKGNTTFFGLLLVGIGIILLLNALFDWHFLRMSNLWPLFLLVPGLTFEYSYFSNRKNPGVLVPGGILTVLGLLFFFEIITNWRFSEYTWPVYIFSVAIGLYQLYLFSGKPHGLLIPILILTLIAGISQVLLLMDLSFSILNSSIIVPCICIGLGLFFIFVKNKQPPKN